MQIRVPRNIMSSFTNNAENVLKVWTTFLIDKKRFIFLYKEKQNYLIWHKETQNQSKMSNNSTEISYIFNKIE